MLEVDQVLFGYRDGHRQLAGSTQLSREDASLLLGVTDASVGGAGDHLVTGLPLNSSNLYALSLTWPAPESDRPGAVWAHALLIGFDDLGVIDEPGSLIRYMRRPHDMDFESYNQVIQIPHEATQFLRVDTNLLRKILAGVLEFETPVIVHPDLESAEQTLLAFWNVQWPALRMSFAFRTRDTFRAGSKPSFIGVARRIRGMGVSSNIPTRYPTADGETSYQRGAAVERDSAEDNWVDLLEERENAQELRRFLFEFGPDESPQLRSLAFLAELHELTRHAEVHSVLARLRDAYPKSGQGARIKAALFGKSARQWWRTTEKQLVIAILQSRAGIFDPRSLKLTDRLQKLVRQGLTVELVASRNRSGPKSVRQCLLDALTSEGDAATFADVTTEDWDLAMDLLRSRKDLVTNSRVWSSMDGWQAKAILTELDMSHQAMVAAAKGDQFGPLFETVSFSDLILNFASAGEFGLVGRAFASFASRPGRMSAKSIDRERLRAATAGVPIAQIPGLLESLDKERRSPDDLWLRAAVSALASSNQAELGEALKVVFGPLHQAITDDRLPHELWKDLDHLLPPADDPALRLRQFLLHLVRKKRWTKEDVREAIRESGPFIDQLLHEVDKKDPIRKTINSALSSR